MHLHEHFKGCTCLRCFLMSHFVSQCLSKAGVDLGSWTQRAESLRTGMSWHRIEYIYGGSILRRQFLPSWWIRKESAGLEAEARVIIKAMPCLTSPNSDSSWVSSTWTKNLWEYSRLKPYQHSCVHLGFSRQKNKQKPLKIESSCIFVGNWKRFFHWSITFYRTLDLTVRYSKLIEHKVSSTEACVCWNLNPWFGLRLGEDTRDFFSLIFHQLYFLLIPAIKCAPHSCSRLATVCLSHNDN